MKKVVCSAFGTIYYARILKDGLMSGTDRVDVTDDAMFAVMQSLTSDDGYEKNGFCGYQYNVGGVPINLIAYDRSKWKLVERGNEE